MAYIFPLDEVRALTLHHYSTKMRRLKVADQNRCAGAIAGMQPPTAAQMLDKLHASGRIEPGEYARLREAIARMLAYNAQLML